MRGKSKKDPVLVLLEKFKGSLDHLYELADALILEIQESKEKK